jgi:hypothetical protein
MLRVTVSAALALLAIALPHPAFAQGGDKAAKKPKLIQVLNERIDMKDLQVELTLKEFLGYITDVMTNRQLDLPFVVDTEAFKQETPDLGDLLDTRIRFVAAPRQMTVAAALRVALDRVPTNNATFVIMPDHILITTNLIASPGNKLTEKVTAVFDKRPLHAALRELSENSGTSIVIDTKRVGEKANIEVTATFLNDADLGGVLRVLTEMADLKVLVLDGTIFVTTPAHADTIRQEYRKRMQERKEMDIFEDPFWPQGPSRRNPSRGRDAAAVGLPALTAKP